MAIAKYTYLPWLRRGIANAIAGPPDGSRAVVEVSLSLDDGERIGAPIPKKFHLTGPGDVIGMIRDVIVRTEPRAEVTDFEPNYLAFVDFYDEDLPWRHTPAPPAGERLVPWLTLLVLAAKEFEVNRSPARPLPSVRILDTQPKKFFPNDQELWAWAHVQLLGDVPGANDVPDAAALTDQLGRSPDSGVGRLISPRRLSPNTRYTAFIVPTFEVGRLACLGQKFDDAAVSGVKLSWADGADEFPIYYEWSFRTGDAGDFEDLVERMQPRPIDKRVGVRDIDIAAPGFGMPNVATPVGPDHHEGVVGLEGALKAPTMEPKPLDPRSQFPQQCAPIVNLPADAQAAGEGDPVVAPPLYGGWHALVDRVDPNGMSGWVHELSLDPRERAAAGLGARVIRARQEDYMKLAWQQVGEVLAANRRAAFFRFAQRAAEKGFAKHLVALPAERFLTLTAPVFTRVMGSPRTIRAQLASSRLPVAAMSPAFRKLTRPRGLVATRALPPSLRRAATSALATAINDGRASAAPPPPPPAGPTFGEIADAVGSGLGGTRFLARWGWLLIALLLLLAAVAWFVLGGIAGLAVAAALAGGAVAAFAAMRRAEDTVRSGANLHLEALTPDDIPAAAPPGFGFSQPGDTAAPVPAPAAAAEEFRVALREFAAFTAAKPPAVEPAAAFDMSNAFAKVKRAIDPAVSFPRRAAAVIRIGDRSIVDYANEVYLPSPGTPPPPPGAAPAPRIVPVMAYPDIKDAMYDPLAKLSNDLLVPNLGLVPPNTISLMLTNPPFIEAYMAGLNHEFARELLWREYPTDCRGTPFRQFWEVGGIPTPGLSAAERARKLKDILPLHEWNTDNALGTHGNRGGVAGHVVLVLRGDLLKRYPNTIIYAQDAVWSKDPDHRNELALYDEDGEKALGSIVDPKIHYPLFVAPVGPDLTFIGFDATLETVRGDPALDETPEARANIPANKLGWFFVLQEVVGETRFGLDEKRSPAGTQSDFAWDNLSWENLDFSGNPAMLIQLAKPFAHPLQGHEFGDSRWTPAEGTNAAYIAEILRQKPVLVGVHGRQMLERGKVDET